VQGIPDLLAYLSVVMERYEQHLGYRMVHYLRVYTD